MKMQWKEMFAIYDPCLLFFFCVFWTWIVDSPWGRFYFNLIFFCSGFSLGCCLNWCSVFYERIHLLIGRVVMSWVCVWKEFKDFTNNLVFLNKFIIIACACVHKRCRRNVLTCYNYSCFFENRIEIKCDMSRFVEQIFRLNSC